MDRRDEIKQEKDEEGGEAHSYFYVNENGKNYRIPYNIIKQATITNVSKSDMIDMQHAARLQYRLMLNDAIIKARVDFTKSKITIIYNPKGSDNIKPKISLEEIIELLSKEGIRVNMDSVKDEDYDYKAFYNYAFGPKQIRERPPYTYTHEEWDKMKAAAQRKKEEARNRKLEKFHEWQEKYAKEHEGLV
ncbi:MAG: hypothetical protein ACP5TL_01895 [Candidatus Micrarchaeia archaeon]